MDQPIQKMSSAAPQAIHHELRTAENSAAYLLPTLHSMKESNPNLTLLDVAAGSGTISVAFAKLIPNGHVTATDLNKDILLRAETIAEDAGVKNIRFQPANAYELPFDDGTFDITHCHQVLCHLKEPWKVVSEMLRVTKAGGVLAAREGDFETECLWPESPAFLGFHKLIARFMQFAGGSPTAGRELLSWALKAGARRDQITSSYGTWYYNTPGDREVWAQGMMNIVRGGRTRKAVLESGLATEDELEDIAKAWEEWKGKEDASLGMMQGEVLIQK